MDVYLESAPENMTPELALHACETLEERWNGWVRPLATAAAFGSFLDRWRLSDPDGLWGYVTEVGSDLVCSVPDSDEPSDVFPEEGVCSDGTPLYDLTGWAWVLKPRDS